MEILALRPHLLAKQAPAHTCVRSLSGLRPPRVAVIFSGRRAFVPRNRTAACVAAADVEEAQQVATEAPPTPAEGRQPRGQDANGGARRRDGNQGRRRKLEQKYQISDLTVGMEVEGLVGALTAFGAFVDIGLGGKDALIHISQLSDGFVSEVDKYVQPGQTIKARIHNVDIASNKVGLTMRSPEAQQQRAERQAERSGERQDRSQAPVQARARRAPRERKEIKYPPVGEELTGKVDAVTNFGVFVKVNDDLRALLHQDEVVTKDGRDPDIRAMFNVGEDIKVRVMKVDAKNRRVDLTQRTEEERAADKALTEQGARSVRVSGLNSMGAALARAGIRKQDFEDLSQAPVDGSEPAAEVPAAAAPSNPAPEVAAVEDEPAAAPSPAAALEQEDASASTPESVPEAPAAEDSLPNTQSSPTPLDEVAPIEEPSPMAEATSPSAADEAAPATQEPEPEVFPSAAEAAPAEEAAAAMVAPEADAPEVETAPEAPEASSEAGAAPAAEESKTEELPEESVPPQASSAPADPDTLEPAAVPAPEPAEPEAPEPEEAAAPEAAAAPELDQAPAPEAAPAAEEPSSEAIPAAEAATDDSSATLDVGGEAAPEPAVEAALEQAASSPAPAEAGPDSTAADSAAPFKVDAKAAKALRDQTGAGMMDAKKALMETQGDITQAVEWLRKKGLSSADKKSGRVASEGVIASYIHAGSRLGVLVELNCETDFVARGDKFKELVSDMAMQIAASSDISVVSVDNIPEDVKQKEFDIEMGKEDIQAKPENIRPKIVEGRVAKTLKTMALLEQPFIKDTDKDVASVIKEAVSTLGENIQIRRFEKFVLGEGIEKKTNDLAKEVEEQTKAFEEAAAKKAAAVPESDAPAPEAAAEPAQVKVDAQAVKQLRQMSGAGMMDAKKALQQTGGDVDKALESLRKKGLASADKKAGRLASEGAIGAYIHAGSRLGVLVEVNCETDFVARGDQFKELVQDIAMQIAASPGVDIVSIDEAPQEELERERALEMQKEDIQSKPEAIRGKIVDGRVQKIFKERALLEQAFIKDTSKTVADHIKAQVATIGENMQVRRFARFVLGEGIEKKQEDFAAEIAAATGQA